MSDALLDPWADTALRGTITQFYGVGANSDLPDGIRFLGSVASLINRRLSVASYNEEHGSLAIFLLKPDVPEKNTRHTKRYPMLDNGQQRISGNFWFVNILANDGRAIELEDSDDDEKIFSLVIDSWAIGDIPAIILDTRTTVPEARFYPNGLGSTDTCHSVRLQPLTIELDEIGALVDRLHQQYLCTPDVQGRAGKLWKDCNRGFPADDAEDEVSIVIRTGLIGAFPTCVIRAEQPQPTGRLDIEIEEQNSLDRSQVVRHAILELKILRSKRSSGDIVSDSENRQRITDGVHQASAYQRDRGSRLTALYCFDMRKDYAGDACFDHVRTTAASLEVELRSWHLFSTSASYRAFCAERSLAAEV
jgi:hypothetical protein